MALSIFEVMEGAAALLKADEETGVLITVNGSYFDWWMACDGGWVCTGNRATGLPNGLHDGASLSSLMDRAEQWFREVMGGAAAEG